MSNKTNRAKLVNRHRVKIGKDYAALDFELHEKGVLVPCADALAATTFKTNHIASLAIKRTRDLQIEIEGGMFPEWKKFDPLRYTVLPTVEVFQVEEDEETDEST